MLLPQIVDRLQLTAALLDVPEGPAVARRSALERGADLVDRPGVSLAGNRAVGADARRPAAFRVHKVHTGRDQTALDQQTEGDTRLLPPVENRFHRAFIQLKRRIDPFARDLDVGRLALDPDPAAAQPARDGSGR